MRLALGSLGSRDLTQTDALVMQLSRSFRVQHLLSATLLLRYVLTTFLTYAASATAHEYSYSVQQRRNMNQKIATFVESLHLPSAKAQILVQRLDHDSNLETFLEGKDYDTTSLIRSACLTAETCLGVDSVDTPSPEQLEVDSNWSEPSPL